MQISEYCRQILFGTSIDDKLAPIVDLSDSRPGTGIDVPAAPGRPRELQFPNETAPRRRGRFPGTDALQHALERGRALHFFANHELLALELMALTLLRFPDAPSNFRRRTVATMVDEQRHMHKYLGRMHELGVGFGDIPVSPFFWRCLADVDSLEQFVAGMALTFEQANLDFAVHYRDRFAEVGDDVSARVMQEVYEDEIRHVRHGVDCMRAWSPPGRELFAAHRSGLRPPLTTARAKGIGFCRDARRRAGLDETYIERLAVDSASKGRAPAVYLFNPSCEFEIVHGEGYNPPAVALRLERDLETLMMFLAAADDLVLVERIPDPEFLTRLREQGGVVAPEFAVLREHRRTISKSSVWHPRISSLRPWGFSPVAVRRLARLRERLPSESRATCPDQWTASREALHRKSTAADWLRSWVTDASQANEASRWCSPPLVGQRAADLDAVDRHIQAGLAAMGRGDEGIVAIKAPLGTSGKNIVRLFGGRFDIGQRGWVANVIRDQGEVVVEPWLDVCVDLSSRAWVHEDGEVEWRGRSRFVTDIRGQYRAGILGPLAQGCTPEVLRFMHDDGRERGWLAARMLEVARFVGGRLHAAGYVGPLGIDAFIYREPPGEAAGNDAPRLRFKPIVEVNTRYTMGHVLAGIQSRVAGGRPGLWTLVRLEDVEAAGFSDAAAFVEHCQRIAPVSTRDGLVERGAWFTTDPRVARQVLSLAVVARSRTELCDVLARLGPPVHDLVDVMS